MVFEIAPAVAAADHPTRAKDVGKMALEMNLSGEVFKKAERDYDADPGGNWPAGTSRKATILDFETREIHEVRFRGAEGQVAYARLAVDEHVDLIVRPNSSAGKLVLDFAGYAQPVAVAPVKSAEKTA